MRLATRISWRARNLDRRLRQRPDLAHGQERFLDGLRNDGVVKGEFTEIFEDDTLYEAAHTRALGLRDAVQVDGTSDSGTKSFLTRLLPDKLDWDDPFWRLALHPAVLDVVAAYLGMRPYLRSMDLWLSKPTGEPPKDTQLWHRDHDDHMNVKFYVYFTDVLVENGPLAYAVGTHPVGEVKGEPERDESGRSDDQQMAPLLAQRGVTLCDGPRSTIAMADTCGYHKQYKPVEGERLKLMVQYTSGTPFHPRTFDLAGVPSELDPGVRAAVYRR